MHAMYTRSLFPLYPPSGRLVPIPLSTNWSSNIQPYLPAVGTYPAGQNWQTKLILFFFPFFLSSSGYPRLCFFFSPSRTRNRNPPMSTETMFRYSLQLTCLALGPTRLLIYPTWPCITAFVHLFLNFFFLFCPFFFFQVAIPLCIGSIER